MTRGKLMRLKFQEIPGIFKYWLIDQFGQFSMQQNPQGPVMSLGLKRDQKEA